MIQRNPSKLTVLTMVNVDKDKEFQRIHKKEFRYKGEMYDIVREIKTGHTTVFICTHDTKESKLFAGLKRINQNKQHLAVWNQLVMIFLSKPFLDLNPLLSGELIFPEIEILLKSAILQIWGPPPELS